MSNVADRFVVILDANILYPFRIRDALLRFFEAGLFRARWTNEILDEWQGALKKNKPHTQASIVSQRQAMAEVFEDAWVEGYEPLVPSLSLPDADDRHVLAAAIRCGAQHIITENKKDFPAVELSKFSIEAVSADQFLSDTFELYPPKAAAALKKMRTAYRNPPMTRSEFLLDLNRAGLPKLVHVARPFIDDI